MRTWFGNHTRDCVRGTDSRHVLDLSGKANRRPLPLQPAQAYSILYYAEGTPLYSEIRTLYDKYKEGDVATVAKVDTLLKKSSTTKTSPETGATTPQDDTTTPQPDATTPQDDTTPQPTDTTLQDDATAPQPNAITLQPNTTSPQPDAPATQVDTNAILDPPEGPKGRKPRAKKSKSKKATVGVRHPSGRGVPKFLVFQQAIIREKVKTMSDTEADAVDALIEERYAAAIAVWESPWTAPKSGQEGVSEIELENQFYQTYVLPPLHTI